MVDGADSGGKKGRQPRPNNQSVMELRPYPRGGERDSQTDFYHIRIVVMYYSLALDVVSVYVLVVCSNLDGAYVYFFWYECAAAAALASRPAGPGLGLGLVLGRGQPASFGGDDDDVDPHTRCHSLFHAARTHDTHVCRRLPQMH